MEKYKKIINLVSKKHVVKSILRKISYWILISNKKSQPSLLKLDFVSKHGIYYW